MAVPSIILEKSGAKQVADYLNNISANKILDVATGDGNFIRTLAPNLKNFEQFIGIDCCADEIKKAKKLTKDINVNFEQHNGEKLPYPDEEFDAIAIAHSLHHLEDIQSVLQEMYRVLKFGGYFIIQEPFRDGEQAEAQNSDILMHTLEAEIDMENNIFHNQTFTKEEITNIIDICNFREINQFIISRYVKCLTCEDAIICDDPKDPRITDHPLKELDQMLLKVKNKTKLDEYQKKVDRIRKCIETYGHANASVLFMIARK